MRGQSFSVLFLGLLLGIFFAAPAAAQAPGFITIGNYVQNNPESDVQDHPDNLSMGMFNGRDEAPFLDAIDALKNSSGFALGGQIEVLAGEYSFKNPVLIDIPGVSIQGSRGAVIRRGAGTRLFTFDANAHNGRIAGIQLVDDAAIDDVTLVAVQAPDFTLTNTRIVVESTGSAVTGYNAVRLIPPAAPGTRPGALIEGNEFAFGEGAAGVVGLRSERGRGLRVIGNRFALRSDLPPSIQYALVGAALVLRNEELSTVSANVFHGLRASFAGGSEEAEAENAIVAFINDGNHEGHHVCLTGNYFEVLAGRSIVNLAGGKFCSITGNAFGRVSGADGAIRLGPPLGGSQLTGTSNVISGNQFHNATLGVDGNDPRAAIYVKGQSTPSIGHNQFTICNRKQIELEDVYGASVTGNQFVATNVQGIGNIPEAIFLNGVVNSFVNGNVASKHGSSAGACWEALAGGTSVDAQISNNHVFDPCSP